MEDYMFEQKEVAIFESLEKLDEYYEKFKDALDRYKEVRGDKFTYELDPDYDKLELTISFTLNLKKEDDYSERDPQLN